jgi:glycosyltransferase involved in cell wall biosynthesis
MKIALCSTSVPFVDGGYRAIVDWLAEQLDERGHEVERVYIPQVDAPESLYRQMAAFRWIDLSAADRVICFRPQSHMIRHPDKVLWFIHHVRRYYDLWESDVYGMDGHERHTAIRDAIRAADTAAIDEASAVFTNSRVVSDRLQRFNGVSSSVLYPPIHRPERFSCREFGDEIVYMARTEYHKRQHLLIEAMRYTTTPVRLRLCGTSASREYVDRLRYLIDSFGLADRVTLEDRWVTEDEKVLLMSTCLAAAYVPTDEDSYGYSTLEAAHSHKPLLTTTDSGGVLEFVVDGVNGWVYEPTAVALAEAMDAAYEDRSETERRGGAAFDRIDELGISWSLVVERLLS